MRARLAYGKVDGLAVAVRHEDIPAPAVANDDAPRDTGSVQEPSGEADRRRRQLVQLAEAVSLGASELRDATGKITTVERLLEERVARRRAGLLLKRGIDIAGAAFALLLLLPLLTLAALAVKLTTPGPIIYSQLRHGLNGRPFRIYKFRTFHADRCDDSGTRQAIPGDQRITPVGHLFRRTNIDELPQLWNVLKGDMSLVGPRPHAIGMHAGGMKYEQLVLAYPMRTLVKPGITGLAQLRGFRGPTWNRCDARMRIVCDLQYVAERSNLLDAKIMAMTVVQEIRGGTGG
jgi:lipopolysaccharide/colanic/teichoic acid biosynthesis glycosyltransferase